MDNYIPTNANGLTIMTDGRLERSFRDSEFSGDPVDGVEEVHRKKVNSSVREGSGSRRPHNPFVTYGPDLDHSSADFGGNFHRRMIPQGSTELMT